MTYNLARVDYTRKDIVATVGGIDAAIAHLYCEGYDDVMCEEDSEHPNHWDIFACGKGRADVYTVEPAADDRDA